MPPAILTVCTGNIARSPVAELCLRLQVPDGSVVVRSVGTSAQPGAAMTPEAREIVLELGASATDAETHRARRLSEADLAGVDLVLAMTREHRKQVVELSPRVLRCAFTVREFERLAQQVTDADIRAAADEAGADAHDRLRAALSVVAAVRGTVDPPVDATDDDVLDPAGRSWNTYTRSMEQLLPAVDEVGRVIRTALA